MSKQDSSNRTRSQLEDAIVEYAAAVTLDEESFSQRTSDWRQESWDNMLNAIDEHEEMLYKEAYKDGRNEAFNAQAAEMEKADNV